MGRRHVILLNSLKFIVLTEEGSSSILQQGWITVYVCITMGRLLLEIYGRGQAQFLVKGPLGSKKNVAGWQDMISCCGLCFWRKNKVRIMYNQTLGKRKQKRGNFYLRSSRQNLCYNMCRILKKQMRPSLRPIVRVAVGKTAFGGPERVLRVALKSGWRFGRIADWSKTICGRA